MKCLSLHQPWASMVALGAKQIETRSWQTSYTGPVLIHASKHWNNAQETLCRQYPFRAVLETNRLHSLGFGCLLCIVELLGCVPTEKLRGPDQINDQERALGDFSTGRFGWVFRPVQMLIDPPLYIRGYQGLFDVNLRAELNGTGVSDREPLPIVYRQERLF